MQKSISLKDFCSSLIIRHYKDKLNQSGGFSSPDLSKDDLNELLTRWALSNSVARLAKLIVNNPNLLNRTLVESVRETSGELQGEVLARDSLIRQLQTGDSARFVVVESSPSLLNGPNHIVAWVLAEADQYIDRLIRRANSKTIPDWIHERRTAIKQALKNYLLQDLLSEVYSKRRPKHQSKREAGRSRNPIYKDALIALNDFELVELFDASTILSLMNETMLSNLDNWQLLELATGLAAAKALGEQLNSPVNIRLRLGNEREIAQTGPYSVVWQNSLPPRKKNELDESELLAKEIATFIGSDLAQSRVDISVVDKKANKDIAHFECKWFSNPDYARSAISDASLQICRYARDSRPHSLSETKSLLKNSMIIVSELGRFQQRVTGTGPVGFTDFAGIANGALNIWASKLIKP